MSCKEEGEMQVPGAGGHTGQSAVLGENLAAVGLMHDISNAVKNTAVLVQPTVNCSEGACR